MQVPNINSYYPLAQPNGGLTADFYSSATVNVDFSQPFQTAQVSSPKAGDLVLARVEEVNSAYPFLELPDGREVLLEPGKTLIGALGTRRALHGFSGVIPGPLFAGQTFQLLNKGGIIGDCTAFHRDLEWPTLLTYLGSLMQADRVLNLKDFALPMVQGPLPTVPLVLVLGTCMNSGKTTVCETIIKSFSRRKTKINAGKVAGVACRKDLISMQKAGAEKVLSFHDFGLSSSADVPSLVPIARSMVHHLADPLPSFLVLEMGDGILGGYHVASLFSDQELLDRQAVMILCANDLMGVWGSLEWLKQNGVDPDNESILVSGPVTDSAEGVQFIERNWNVAAANPLDSAGKLCSFVFNSLNRC